MSNRLGDVPEPLPESMRRVCVWFGEHLIIDHLDDPNGAVGFEAVMRRRFTSLRVTNEPANGVVIADVVES